MNKSKTKSRPRSTRSATKNNIKAKIPTWMDCAWRRLPCGKADCPLCSQMAKDKKKSIVKSKNLDAVSDALEDVGKYFEMLQKRIDTLK